LKPHGNCFYNYGWTTHLSVDNSGTTAWTSNGHVSASSTEWAYVDFTAPRQSTAFNCGKLRGLVQPSAISTDFSIQTSTDAQLDNSADRTDQWHHDTDDMIFDINKANSRLAASQRRHPLFM